MRKKKPELFSNYRFRELVDEFVQGDINKQILVYFYVDDMTQEAIEEELRVSVSTIKRVCKKYGIPIFRMMNKDEP